MATLVTGGAGFIGSALVARLLEEGERVTVLDDLSTAAPDWADRLAGNVRFVRADAADRVAVREAVDGCERIVHLASSTDIAGGFCRPALDFRGCVVTTEVVCEVAQEAGVREMWLASSGVVYGRAVARPSPEDAGPLYPESHYAAAKLAAEAILSGFANLYGWRSLIFRFGNTIGPGSDHGLVHDLVVKVLRDPRRVEILGDGEQRKPYVHVDDLVDAMLFAGRHAERAPVVTFNVGHPGTLSVRRVAELVLDGLGVDG